MVDGTGARAASWKPKTELVIGSEVFTIGNPQHLDWTHTRGSISQLRLQRRGERQVHVIQTDAALNPGNSGGGLYDKSGTLIGINTWTNDKRFSEGLGFAIALDSLLGTRSARRAAARPANGCRRHRPLLLEGSTRHEHRAAAAIASGLRESCGRSSPSSRGSA